MDKMPMKSRKLQIQNLRSNIDKAQLKILDKILTKTFIACKNFPENWQASLEEVREFYYSSFVETYLLTSQGIKKIYNSEHLQEFDVKNIQNLTYKADGKHFDDRLDEHWAQTAIELTAQDADYRKVFEHLNYKLTRLMNTETHTIETKVKQNLKPKVEYGYMIVIESGCDECLGGEYPADEAIELPPYHPNCQCEWWYEETDDPDEIADLDLEIEEV